MNPSWATVIEALVAMGFFESLRQLIRRFVNRRRDSQRARLDDAQAIQGMSLNLLGPLEHRLARADAAVEAANERADRLLRKIHGVEEDFDALFSWARNAKTQLEAHGIPVPPIPPRRQE